MKHILIFSVFWCLPAFAQLDNASEEAVVKTQQLLKSNVDRQKYIDSDPKAKAADDKAAEVAGSKENKDEMYDISAGITRTLANRNGGDANKMQEELTKAATNPEAFYNSLSPEEKAQIHALAEKIGSKKPMGLQEP